MRASIVISGLFAMFAAACTHGEAQSAADMIDDGRAIAASQCASCHAIDQGARSPRPDAPPFVTIGARYKFPVLEEELIQGIKLGHPDMPQFQFPPTGVDSLIAYLRSIQEADRKARP